MPSGYAEAFFRHRPTLTPGFIFDIVTSNSRGIEIVNFTISLALSAGTLMQVGFWPYIAIFKAQYTPAFIHAITPSLFHSGLKSSFSANPSHRSLPFLLRRHFLLHGFLGLLTDTSEHIRFLLFSFSVFHFFVVGSVR